MERWIPLFQLFLHSPCAEGEASLWLQLQPPPPTAPGSERAPSHVTSAFLSLLEAPTTILSRPSSTSSPTLRRCVWMQTLPPAVQFRILTFLAVESHRFCCRRLRNLASRILEAGDDVPRCGGEHFWVARAARNLFDIVSHRGPPDLLLGRPSKRSFRDENGVQMDEEFDAVPEWLSSIAAAEVPLLPWLPLSPDRLRELDRASRLLDADEKMIDAEEDPEEATHKEKEALSQVPMPDMQPLTPRALDKASSLRAEIPGAASAPMVVRIADEIRSLCFELAASGKNILQVLSLVEPWKLDDEAAAVLLAHLCAGDGLVGHDWPGYLLCSVILPKLLVLQNPTARSLLSATIDCCKGNQSAAVNALLLPLMLRKEGINTPLCDALSKMVKECLHPAHISACCQKLLRGDDLGAELICLPCHRDQIAGQLQWTEALFSLFQHFLSCGAQLTPDSVDRLLSLLPDMARKFPKSLKFCNFLLCLVSRCPYVLRCHKLSMVRVAESTDTFLTKSILSKLW